MLVLLYNEYGEQRSPLVLHTLITSVTSAECARSVERLADDVACKALVGAVAQCIYLLYALDLTERDEQWTDGFQVSHIRIWILFICGAGSMDKVIIGA